MRFEYTSVRAESHAQRSNIGISGQAPSHAKKTYELTAARLQETQALPAKPLSSIQTLSEIKQARIDAILDYNVAQHRLLAAMGHPYGAERVDDFFVLYSPSSIKRSLIWNTVTSYGIPVIRWRLL